VNNNSSRKDATQVAILALGVTVGAIVYMVIRYSWSNFSMRCMTRAPRLRV